jgi:hypothetical protein
MPATMRKRVETNTQRESAHAAIFAKQLMMTACILSMAVLSRCH